MQLEIKHLTKRYGDKTALDDFSYCFDAGIYGILGANGAGKTTLMNLITDNVRRDAGEILFNGTDVLKLGKRFRAVLGYMPQQQGMYPDFSARAFLLYMAELKEIPRKQAREQVEALLEMVNLQDAAHKKLGGFSGGMRQRAVLAIALAGNPQILFADEPTTALDVTVQAQILDLLRDVQQKLGTATVLVSHDLGVVARAADRVAVMYAGRIVEIGTAEEVYYDPRHPYTWALLRALPALARHGEPLYTIPGMPPTLIDPPAGDAFAERNEYALAIDYREAPPMFQITDTHFAATWLLDPRAPKVAPPLGGLRHEG